MCRIDARSCIGRFPLRTEIEPPNDTARNSEVSAQNLVDLVRREGSLQLGFLFLLLALAARMSCFFSFPGSTYPLCQGAAWEREGFVWVRSSRLRRADTTGSQISIISIRHMSWGRVGSGGSVFNRERVKSCELSACDCGHEVRPCPLEDFILGWVGPRHRPLWRCVLDGQSHDGHVGFKVILVLWYRKKYPGPTQYHPRP